MKRIILILSIAMLGCSDDTVNKQGCNCGLILDDRVDDYSILIRNECTGNEKWFSLYPGDWIHAHPGYHYCITNVDSW